MKNKEKKNMKPEISDITASDKKPEKTKSAVKTVCKVLGITLIVILLVVGIYVAYVFISYKRIPDNQTLESESPANGNTVSSASSLTTDRTYSIITSNIGFGAYDDEFDFFMDGGSRSWARSKDAVVENVDTLVGKIADENADFVFLQEMDIDGTRSYHVNEYERARNILGSYSSIFAMNYDSPFLFWPLYQPHGSNKAGIGTFYKVGKFTSSIRRSLPISESFSKVVDLDRCYSVTELECSNGKTLTLINVHLSAYGADESVQQSQLDMLFEDMQKAYDKGNYVIVGGDFNHDMIGDSNERYGNGISEEQSWAKAFPFDQIPSNFTLGSRYLLSEGRFDCAATCRDTSTVLKDDSNMWYLDAFIYSDNIEMISYDTLDYGFQNSDHNPVKMTFRLK